MEYRVNRRTGDRIGVIGFGTSAICEADPKEMADTLASAYESGVNYYDLATSNAKTFPAFGSAFAGVRDKVLYQLHFGADYSAGEYGWTTDGDAVIGRALTEYQCIRYALDKPGVLTVLPGVRGKDDLKRVLGYFSASEEEKDYSVIGTFAPQDAAGKCVYCNHCKPCPAGIDVGTVNKYYDLARAGDALAADHYKNLAKTAADCIGCGHCNRRCPFRADQMSRMKEIAAYFGK